jgi:hypothetical protein
MILLCSFMFFGCAKNAPELPTDYSSIHSENHLSDKDFEPYMLKLTCEQIATQLKELNTINEDNVNKIKATRTGDQTAGYFATLLFPPLWFAIDTHDDTKVKIDEVNKQKDSYYKLQVYKSCTNNQPE